MQANSGAAIQLLADAGQPKGISEEMKHSMMVGRQNLTKPADTGLSLLSRSLYAEHCLPKIHSHICCCNPKVLWTQQSECALQIYQSLLA